MIRKTLIIFSLVGLLLSVGLWGVSHFGFGYSVGTESFTFRNGGVEWSSLSASQHLLLDKQALANWNLSVHSSRYRVGAWGRVETHWPPSRQQRRWGRIKLLSVRRRSSWANRYAGGNRYTLLWYDEQYIWETIVVLVGLLYILVDVVRFPLPESSPASASSSSV